MSAERKPYEEIAPRVRALREAVDMSLEELAGRTGLSPEEVARFESGTVEIPVSFLYETARACNVDLTVLLSGGDAHLKEYTVVRKGEGLSVDRRKDYAYKSLAYRFTHRRMEPFFITVPPKEPDALNFQSHPGQEFIYMLAGRLEITLGDKRIVLESGDSLYFASRVPHALRGLDGLPAEFIDVIN
ncbi:MAG: helix-turn-helix transcriptional regulator [Desulfovibrionaceae bacterium]|jgi:transcriptional regulator with XRE-family HTH domain|nr:helix-turn-helix transcriptional regulator [Desulfovibrionaceae bacterium]